MLCKKLVTSFAVAVVLTGLGSSLVAQEGMPPAPVRAIIEGTWELIEWHHQGEVLTPPQMEGRWMVHDGWVMAIRHRDAPPDFESTAGYGPYSWGPTTWIYGYDRSEDLRGPSPESADLRVSTVPQRTYNITWEGPILVLEDDRGVGLRWEFDVQNDIFTMGTMDGVPIRVYRRISQE